MKHHRNKAVRLCRLKRRNGDYKMNNKSFSKVWVGGVPVLFFALLVLSLSQAVAQSSEDAYRIERFPVNDGVAVDVRTSGGPIKVIGKNTDEVTVEMYVRRKGDYVSEGKADLDEWEIEITKSGNTVTAHAKREGDWGWNNRNNYSIGFVVYTPTDAASKLKTSGGSISLENLSGDQEAKTSGGSIRAEGLQGEIDLKTSGGRITLTDIEGNVKAGTSGGSISANSIVGDLDVRTSGGRISLEGIEGDVIAKTSGGSINAEVISPKDVIDLRTSGGSITITVPRDSGYDLDLDGNRVRADLQNFRGEYEKDEIQGTLNGGGTRLKARTSGGSVRLKYL